MRPLSKAAVLFLLAASLTVERRAFARDPPKAEGEFREGVALYTQKKYAEAADAFARAYEDSPLEKYLWNEALSELRSSRFWLAYRNLQQYKSDPQAARPNLAHVDDLLLRAEEHLGHLTIDAPAGFTVSVDSVEVGVAPVQAPIEVDPDRSHEVTADKAETHLSAHVTPTGASAVTVRLEEPAPAPPSAPALVPVAVLPASEAIAAPRSASRAARNVTTLVLAGLALASTGAGFGYYLAYENDRNVQEQIRARLNSYSTTHGVNPTSVCALQPMLPDCSALPDIYRRWNRNVFWQDAFYVGAGVSGVAAVVTFLLWPSHAAKASARLLPRVDRGGGSLTLYATF